MLATSIDNIYVVAPSAASSVHILEAAEAHLLNEWGPIVKESSRQLLVSTAGGSAPCMGTARWPVVEKIMYLGHELSNNGSVVPCWHQARRQVLRSLYRNAGCLAAVSVPISQKLTLLRRAT